ncbi:hypothetical protein HBI25_112170 [Parastagonospora nodorum]|nr:hypothetical protein HBH52_093130 [Parastagonospora nodorum]KAH4039748.1 hypothetical protein HBI09_036170 [Parastagonospora nodorum]KAH4108164.1 hypothetical protein HBH46_044140 [Parastagonospora nodorum]KAH4201206.1 hypothetical protein HBH42_026300 [Parastagonospora nodorum]KAH5000015.1 hypothetical protein HBI77_162880 [Parastagonospora nodorum]
MNGSFQTHEEDESTSAYDHRPISDHDDMRHYNTYEAYPSFLPLAPPFQQGSWEPRAPASPCPVITGTFLSNDPLHERSQMIHDNVANGEWYTNGYSDSVAARPHGSTEDQPQGYGPHQWSYSEPTVITGPNVAYRANATHIQTPSYLSDAGQASRSQFPANLSLDATQEPWSAVAAHPGGYNMLSSNLQSGDEISHYPENTISSTSSFINGTGAITPDSSWPNNVVDQAGSCNFGPSVLSIRMKDVEHETHGLQEQGASQFQYNVQEGSPSTNHNVHEHVAAPKDAW